MVVDEGSGSEGDGTFLVPSTIVWIPALELSDRRNGSGEKHSAVGPFRFSGLFERFEITSDRRFANPGGFAQVGQGDESVLANQFAQTRASGCRAHRAWCGLRVRGRGVREIHPLADGVLSILRR